MSRVSQPTIVCLTPPIFISNRPAAYVSIAHTAIKLIAKRPRAVAPGSEHHMTKPAPQTLGLGPTQGKRRNLRLRPKSYAVQVFVAQAQFQPTFLRPAHKRAKEASLPWRSAARCLWCVAAHWCRWRSNRHRAGTAQWRHSAAGPWATHYATGSISSDCPRRCRAPLATCAEFRSPGLGVSSACCYARTLLIHSTKPP